MDKKAQASAEYIIVIAMLLIVLATVVVIFLNIYGQLKAQTNYHLARDFVFQLSQVATKVYYEGDGAKKILFLSIPNFAINFSSSKILNKTIIVNVNDFGDVYQRVDFNLEGYFLPNQSSGYFLIENNGSVVKIIPATKFYISKAGFYFNSTFSNQTIELKNYGHINLTLNQTFNIPGCSSCTYNDTSSSILQPYESRIGRMSIGSLSSGIYNGYLKIEAKNNLNYANHTFVLPITIEIN